MPIVLSYCLKFSVSIALVFLFYQLVLRKLTFYNWNRYYLLGYALLSFFVAFIDISPVLQQNELAENHFVKWIPVLNSSAIISTNETTTNSFSFWNVIVLLFVVGMIIMLFRLIIQLFSFRRMMKKAEPISIGEMKFYQVNESIIPFSFGKSIFINRNLHTEEELQEIIRHEFVHVKQKHSIDIIVGEVLCLFNWYNPFAWLLKRSIRQNLEFIADNKVLENGINKKEYQYLLLKVIGNNQFSIAQKFNFSSLKKRIAMMNKFKTAKIHLVRFLFMLPLMVVLLMSFRSIKKSLAAQRPLSHLKNDTLPAPNMISPEELQKEMNEINSFSNHNPEIVFIYSTEDKTKHIIFLKNGVIEKYGYSGTPSTSELESKYGILPALYKETQTTHTDYDQQWNHISQEASKKFNTAIAVKAVIFPGDSRVLVQLKNNKLEIFDMDYDKDRAQFENTFGKLPDCVPPPSRKDDVPAEERSIIINDTTPKPTKAPGKTSAEDKVSLVSDDFEITDDRAVIHLKSGETEEYDLKNKEQREKFEKKYGKIINANVHKGPMTTVSFVTADGVKTAIVPAKVVTSTSSKAVTVSPDVKAVTVVGKPITTTFTTTSDMKEETVVGVPMKAMTITPDVKAVTVTGKPITVATKVNSAVVADVNAGNIYTTVPDQIIRDADIEVEIKNTTTPEELEGFISKLKEKGYELTFTNKNYKDGILTQLSGTIKYKDNNSTFSFSDFKEATIVSYREGDKVIFKLYNGKKRVTT